ncbi:M4 family metallopeptidase [Cladorrhinum sp. PSN259]|nr:M4 family metallopeptidase [Cladorrhinum sp. PSN259]
MASDRGCGCAFIPEYFLQAIAGSDDIDELSKRAIAEARMAAEILESARKLPDSPSSAKDPAAGLSASNAAILPKRKIYTLQWGTDLETGQLWRDECESPVTNEPSVNQCYDSFGHTFKFFADVFGRNSIDDKGMEMKAFLHFSFNWPNAVWHPTTNCMVFGDGFQYNPFAESPALAPIGGLGGYIGNFVESLEVVAHELMHGITQHTSPLEYKKQSGALNESLSDVFGSMVKQYALNQTAAEADWLMGEGVILPGHAGMALRSLKAPGTAYILPGNAGRDPQPSHMEHFFRKSDDNFGVHINSGIPNHAFYIAATKLGGFSWEEAGRVWYEALTKGKLSYQCTFREFAQVTLKFARSRGDHVFTAVDGAWKAVGVL